MTLLIAGKRLEEQGKHLDLQEFQEEYERILKNQAHLVKWYSLSLSIYIYMIVNNMYLRELTPYNYFFDI